MLREPHERGQRALFALCFIILVTITSTGTIFLANVTAALDNPGLQANYASILTPILVGYSILLGCYLAFTLLLPQLLLSDIHAAAAGVDEEEAEDEDGGVLELVAQQLGPPFLVQQSPTLFKRMNTSAMFEAFVGKGLQGLQVRASLALSTPCQPHSRPGGAFVGKRCCRDCMCARSHALLPHFQTHTPHTPSHPMHTTRTPPPTPTGGNAWRRNWPCRSEARPGCERRHRPRVWPRERASAARCLGLSGRGIFGRASLYRQ